MAENTQRGSDAIRKDIDSVDADLVRLLNRRTKLAEEVAKGVPGSPNVVVSLAAERAAVDQVVAESKGPLTSDQLRTIFREIVSAGRTAATRVQVAYWGPPGTYTNLAAIETFGHSTTFVPESSIEEVFLSVEHGRVKFGVVPVENSVAGIVPETLDMFPWTNVKIVAETHIAIHHNLVSKAKALKDIQRVYAGPQPSQQCRRWLKEHLPHAEIVEVAPTTKAAKCALDDPHGAAIANRLGAEAVGIPILVERIEDNPKNRTRFYVIGYGEPEPTGHDKTSVMFNLRNEPGHLVRALRAFEEANVNLIMIESRPAQRASFEYIFYVDCVGHQSDPGLKVALAALRQSTIDTIVLGSYPTTDDTHH